MELLEVLPSDGITPSVCTFHRRESGVEELVPAGVKVHHVDATSVRHRVRTVRSLLRSSRIDLVHTTLFEADIVGRLATIGTGVPVLTSLVNMSYEAARLEDPKVSKPRLRLAQLVDALTARFLTTHFHAISEAVKQSSVQHLRIDADRVTVIPRSRHPDRMGTRTAERRRSVRLRLGIPDDAFVLLHVGRQEFQKDHATLLRAYAAARSSIPNALLVLAGRAGNASETIRPLIDQLPRSSVLELGHVDDVPDLLAAADLFVFPSRYEGLGGAVIEAMLMKLPIVATDIPPLRENLGDLAWLTAPANVLQLEDALIDAATNPQLRDARSTEAQAIAISRFSHPSVMDQMTKLIRSVHDSAARSPRNLASP